MSFLQTRGGYREWSDRIPTGAIPERSRGPTGRRVDDVSRRDLEASSLASWSRALDDQRRELLAGVGHELKTPLSIVLGLCGRLLAAADLGEGRAEDVQRIRANAYVLLKRVEELLQVSRLDGGHLDLEPRDVDVARLVRSSCEGFASVAELRDQRLVDRGAAAAAGAPGRGEGAVGRLQPAGQRPEVRAARRDRALHGRRRRRAAAHRGRRQRPGGRGRPARDDLRALSPRRGQRRAARAGPAWAWRSCATSSRCTTAWSPSPTRPRAAPSSSSTCRVSVDGAADGARAGHPGHRSTWPSASARPSSGCGPSSRPTGAARRRPTRARPAATARASSSSRADAELGAFVEELIGRRYAVAHAADALEAARLIADRRPDAVVLDAAAGTSAIAALRRRLGEAPLMTLAASPEDVPGLLLAGAHDCVVKPFGADELQVRLDALVARGRVYARRETALAGPRPRLPRGAGGDGADLAGGSARARQPLAVRAAGLRRRRAGRADGPGPDASGRPARRGGPPPARARAPRDRRSRHVAAGARRRLVPARVGLGLARGRLRRRRGLPALAPRRRARGASRKRRRRARGPARPARLRARHAPPAAALPALRRAGGARALLAARAARRPRRHGPETADRLVARDPRRRAPAPARDRRRRLRRRPRDRGPARARRHGRRQDDGRRHPRRGREPARGDRHGAGGNRRQRRASPRWWAPGRRAARSPMRAWRCVARRRRDVGRFVRRDAGSASARR